MSLDFFMCDMTRGYDTALWQRQRTIVLDAM